MFYVIKGVRGSEAQNFDHLYLLKEIYFDKQCRRKDSQHDLLNGILQSRFC